MLPKLASNRRFTIEQEGLPELPQMMPVTLEALRAIGGLATLHELDQKAVELEGVTEGEQALTMADDNRPRLNYYLAWCRTFLRRGGAIENSSRGVWLLAEKGEQLTTLAEMQAIYEQVNAEEREKNRLKRLAAKQQEKASPVLGTLLGPADDDSDDWKSQLLTSIGDMKSDGFERLSQRLLREAGFTVAKPSPIWKFPRSELSRLRRCQRLGTSSRSIGSAQSGSMRGFRKASFSAG